MYRSENRYVSSYPYLNAVHVDGVHASPRHVACTMWRDGKSATRMHKGLLEGDARYRCLRRVTEKRQVDVFVFALTQNVWKHHTGSVGTEDDGGLDLFFTFSVVMGIVDRQKS